jgi:hypothetical protein
LAAKRRKNVTGRLKTGHLWALQTGHAEVLNSCQVS